ncbi:unnamed protein product [Cylicocyclus nassatus]|uniref:Phlebovirus glycoprotein G2 fusion domain-containing protein n=1 Tax=Cylicocyclus nassatus TaxID=53992 RepID=A0AA36GS17_CYLNA|nr:unnamed protein product [Cylicocyclus nassatus]
MVPNVPIIWNAFTLTLTSVTIPPIPLLNTAFITDGNNTALWNSVMKPPLWCTNKTAAEQLDCTVIDNCQCAPAEVQANCKCQDVSISEMFGDVRNRLPAIFPAVSFKQNDEGQVKAEVQSLTTAEIIVTIQENVRTNVVVDSTVCTIADAILTGCYKCARGAKATIKCTAPKQTQAEIICESASFTVDCDQQGALSELQFSLDRARVQMTCSVSCGTIVTTFEVGGILRFTQTAHGMMTQWLSGNGDQAAETQWPDFWHIAEVFLQCQKSKKSFMRNSSKILRYYSLKKATYHHPSPVDIVLPPPPPPAETESVDFNVTETIVLPKSSDKLDFSRRWLQDDLMSLAHQPPVPIMMMPKQCSNYNDVYEHSLGSCSAEIAALKLAEKEDARSRI